MMSRARGDLARCDPKVGLRPASPHRRWERPLGHADVGAPPQGRVDFVERGDGMAGKPLVLRQALP